MKKISFLTTLTLLLLALFALNASAQESVSVYIEGERVVFNATDTPAQTINGRIMVPMRAIFEEFNMNVLWDGNTQTITGTDSNNVVIMKVNSNEMVVNNKKIVMDVPPTIINGRTLVPIRAVAEGLGVKVFWNGDVSAVTIYSDNGNIEYIDMLDTNNKEIKVDKTLYGKYLAKGFEKTEKNDTNKKYSQLPAYFEKEYDDGDYESFLLNKFEFTNIETTSSGESVKASYLVDFSHKRNTNARDIGFFVNAKFYDENGNLIDTRTFNIGTNDSSYQKNIHTTYIPIETVKIVMEMNDDLYEYTNGKYIYYAKMIELYDKSKKCKVVSEFVVPEYEKNGWMLYSNVDLYAPDGRKITVANYEVDKHIAAGWSKEPLVTMYSLDGRTIAVLQSEVNNQKKVGWYTEPHVALYAPDGRTLAVSQNEVDAHKAVGWYDYPVTTMYAEDGRIIVIPTSEVQSYKSVGWYTETQHEALKYKYLAGSDFRSIRRKYSHAVANGAYLYPYTDSNGDRCIMVFISYKITSNYTAFFMHNITKGTTIENAPDYYDRIADEYWGASKLHYMDLQSDALSAQIKAIEGFQGKIDTGLFVGPSVLNL